MLKFSYGSSGNVMSRTTMNLLPPKIAGQPLPQFVQAREIATFSVSVENSGGMTFQWKFNGADLPGATGDSLLLTNVSAVNEGPYSVVVTNSAGSVTSAPATLRLRPIPAISTKMLPRLIVYSDEGGEVTVNPIKGNYTLGETVTLTATPSTDSVFIG